jgi:hypothetical protein
MQTILRNVVGKLLGADSRLVGECRVKELDVNPNVYPVRAKRLCESPDNQRVLACVGEKDGRRRRSPTIACAA